MSEQPQVLLIEDDPRLGISFTLLFTRLPVRVTLAMDAPRAVECLSHDRYDLLILDLQDLEFFKFSALLKTDPIPACSNTLILSDRIERGDLQKALHCNHIDLLPKPIDPPVLLEAIERRLLLHSFSG
jgi:CheY-like chemotaxis protein